jgi:pimeloyl-ACP methyl ester carboxylesterase
MIRLSTPAIGTVDLDLREYGSGSRTYLVLHGGAGPSSVYGFAELLAAGSARVIVPTHPGFEATSRPEQLNGVAALADVYAALLERLALTDVTVVGNSVGGWIAAELSLRAPNRIGAVVLVGAVGIVVDGHPIPDFFAMNFDEVRQRSYYDPQRFGFDPSALPPERFVMLQSNRAALTAYAGQSMQDATLRARVANLRVPVLVLYGEADRIAEPEYGRAFAEAIPNAQFTILPRSGHLPQLETPEELLAAVVAFANDLSYSEH